MDSIWWPWLHRLRYVPKVGSANGARRYDDSVRDNLGMLLTFGSIAAQVLSEQGTVMCAISVMSARRGQGSLEVGQIP